eukprot:gene720-biopygen4248
MMRDDTWTWIRSYTDNINVTSGGDGWPQYMRNQLKGLLTGRVLISTHPAVPGGLKQKVRIVEDVIFTEDQFSRNGAGMTMAATMCTVNQV